MTRPTAGLPAAGSPDPARPDLRLAGAAAGAWAVSWCCLTQAAGVAAFVALCAAVGLAVALMIVRRPIAVGAALLLLGVTAGATSTGVRVWARDGSPLSALARESSAVTLWLVVTDDPRRVGNQSSYGRRTVALTARGTRLAARGRDYVLGGRILILATDPRWSVLLPSQRVRATGRLSVPRGGDLTVAVLSARGPPTEVSLPSGLQRAAGTLRAGLRQACQGMPVPERGLLPGLVIGDTSGLDPALAEDFRTTGMTHLLAVSGTNCAIVCGAVLLLVRRMRAGPRSAALLAGLALAGFVVLVRPSPSVLRAAVMGGLALLALAAGRGKAALPGLCAAVLVLVLVDPALARSAGFTLSVLATGGLLLLAPPWRDALRRRRWPKGVAEAVAVPAAAQVACAPVIVVISGEIGLVAVPANLLAVPAVAPATVLGVVAAVVSPVWPAGAEFIARLAGVPTAWLVLVAEHGARIPGGTLSWPGGASGGLLLAAALALAVLLARARLIRHMAVCSACVAAVVVLPVRSVIPGWPPQGWVMVACDVGQGDALVLNAGQQAAVVVDAGPEPAAVDGCLRRLHVARVPLVVISHLHIDHVGGLAGVLRGRAVAGLAVGPLHEPAAAWGDVRRQAGAAGVPVMTVAMGETRTVAALRLHVLGPAMAFSGTRSDANNSSLILRVDVAGRALLLSGDAEVAGQQALLAAGVDLRADVVKIAHHGSSYQDPRFLGASRPVVALVSVGAGNTYGHPSRAVLNRLRLLGARVQRTDRDGDIAVVIQQGRLMVVGRGSSGSQRPRSVAQYRARAPPDRDRRSRTWPERCRPVSGRRGTMDSVSTDLLAPLRLAQGDEEFLVARAVNEVIAAARAADAGAEIHDLAASELASGGLAELVSPSLFGGLRVIVVRSAQEAGKDLTAALLGHAADLADGVTLVVTHSGGARGKALVDGMIKAGAVMITCMRPRRHSERLAFVRDEIRAAGGTINDSAAQALLEAVGSDLRELASACSQLVSDTGGTVDEAAVARCHRGRAEVTGFMVADNALAGDVAGALSSLRWALSLGVDPVPIADAIADGIRTVSRVAAASRGNAYAVAGDLKMPPWKVERAQRQARGWSAAGLGRAMQVAAGLNADVKGNAGDTVYALERAVLAIAGERGAA